MNQERDIIKRVLMAQNNIDEADSLIRDYFPFIKSETAKTIGRIPIEGKDDELSIALMGFNEAIESYDQSKGAFLSFAALVVKRRVVDFLRQENKFKHQISWEEMALDDEFSDADKTSKEDEIVDKETLKWEIKQLSRDLERLGISFSDIAANCPKYDKVIASCRKVIDYIISDPEQMEDLYETGRLPVRQITEATSVRKKTLEKHRKYLVALAIIYFCKYDCLIDHLTEVFKNKKGGKCR